MLYVQKRRNGGSYPSPLLERGNLVLVDFRSICSRVGIKLLVEKVLLDWNGIFVRSKRKKTWKTAPLCLFWTIWNERNRRSFENSQK